MSRFFVELFLSDSAEKFRRGAFLCCVSENIREPRSLWIRGEGVSRFSVKQLSSHSAEKFCRGTLQCVTILAYRKKFCFRRLCHDFLSIFFCLTVPKNFLEEPLSAVFQKDSCIEKIYASEGYVTIFCRIFCFTVPKKIVEKPLSAVFQKVSGIEKIYASEGYVTIFHRFFFVSQCRKIL